MAKAKWIPTESPQEPIECVARRALESRLRIVWQRLASAKGKPEDVVEDVHQLRVSVRRAVAALDIFDSLLPQRRTRRMKKRLRRIRRAAGDARDLDVFQTRLRAIGSQRADESLSALLDHVARKRNDAQRPIQEMHRKLKQQNFRKEIAELVKRVRLRFEMDRLSRPTVADAAASALRPVVEEVLAQSAVAPHNYAALHALRIQAKRLRYAMEVFATAFDASFRKELYADAESLQTKLGEINDHHTAGEHLKNWFPGEDAADIDAALKRIIAREELAAEQSRERFLDWWTPDRQALLQHKFAGYLNSSTQCRTSEPQPRIAYG